MNLLVEDPLSKTGFSRSFALFPNPSELGNSAELPAARISRDAMDAFLNAKSDNGRSGHFFVPVPELAKATPEKELALGVLEQAARDLRRFRSATRGVRRELYVDAHDWVTANDFSWPYSFVNVCKLLDLSPDVVRAEVLADASLGWLDFWTQRAGRVSRKVQASVVRIFANCGNAQRVEASQLT
jgi:hypothetical protein